MRVLARIGAPEFKKGPMVLALEVPRKTANAREVVAAALKMADAFEEHRLIMDAGKGAGFLDEMRREAHDLQLSARRSFLRHVRHSRGARARDGVRGPAGGAGDAALREQQTGGRLLKAVASRTEAQGTSPRAREAGCERETRHQQLKRARGTR